MLTLESAPPDATHWSTRSMAKAVGISPSSVHAIWGAFGLKPHLAEESELSPDPQSVDKSRDVVGLYLNPPEAAVVLCVDEKTQIQALDRTAPILPLMPGTPQRRTHDYRRHGTTNLFAALDTASGNVITSMTARHRSEEFRKFLNLIDKEVPSHLDVHVVADNVCAHKTPAVKRRLVAHPRFKPPLHPHLQLLDEPRRALVLRTHHQMAPTRHPHQRQRPQRLNQHLTGSKTGTTTPNPSYGAKPQTRYSTTSPHISTEFPKQDTRRRRAEPGCSGCRADTTATWCRCGAWPSMWMSPGRPRSSCSHGCERHSP